MTTKRLIPLLLLLAAVLSACTTTGTGGGQVAGVGQALVAFSWTSKDGGISGTLSAALGDDIYAGRFFQITSQTRSESLAPLWTHWGSGWHDWPYWGDPHPGPYPRTHFVTHYSGEVVATLEAQDKPHMRCRFHLADPVRGLSGGGEGECQLNDGWVIQAVFADK